MVNEGANGLSAPGSVEDNHNTCMEGSSETRMGEDPEILLEEGLVSNSGGVKDAADNTQSGFRVSSSANSLGISGPQEQNPDNNDDDDEIAFAKADDGYTGDTHSLRDDADGDLEAVRPKRRDYVVALKDKFHMHPSSPLRSFASVEEHSMDEYSLMDTDIVIGDSGTMSSVRSGKDMIPKQSGHSVSFGDIRVNDDSEDHSDGDEDHDSGRIRPRLNPRQSSKRRQMFGYQEKSRKLVDQPSRMSRTVDLETGREGARAQCALIRDVDERNPQVRRRRLQKRAKKAIKNNYFWGLRKKKADGNDSDEEKYGKGRRGTMGSMRNGLMAFKSRSHIPMNDDTQYRIVSVDASIRDERGNFGFSPGFYDEIMAGDDEHGCACFGFKPNQLVITYLFWAFRSNFLPLFLSAASWFFTLTVVFALMIYGIGVNKPYCITVDGKEFGVSFMDAYTLSWTTFSTVGYGLVHPATSVTTERNEACFIITVICTLESFIGILIASFWSAIFLSKLTRISSFAQVTFSDPILIRYGTGVGSTTEDEEDDHSHSSQSDELTDGSRSLDVLPKIHRSELSKIHCPVLEFRLLNKLHGQQRGEIIDASMNIAASVDALQVEPELRGAAKLRHGRIKRKRKGNGTYKEILDADLPEREQWSAAHAKVREMLKTNPMEESRRSKTDVDEDDFDPTESLASRKVFTKISLESQDHPFFKRVWVGKHVLDHESPLLKPEAKELVRLNNGHWPQILNNAKAVRACVKFDQILVSLSGTSNADCNTVYSQKVYDYVDLCVGYKFANCLYRDTTGALNVDDALLNDVMEQAGGGGEDLFDRVHVSSHGQIFIL